MIAVIIDMIYHLSISIVYYVRYFKNLS